ncbi:hypothetical protein K457DRAFT_142516 [Linnemannia elongata AG-77]|uniref:G-protein coupled receptors family 1 profile domain-containing protein n=1 Tax=Linnemannia elongata AG-77 TaxID=1314771 RepID=A0A197JFA8_9FUNG|nr:hypothetical protein K457DRAFT_142516 [Linnemannia elongata AG-77]
MQKPDIPAILSLLVSLLSISLMSLLFGRKTSGTNMTNINYARGLVISLYIVSWAFTTIAAVLTSTNYGNILSCTLSIFVCLSLYAMSKIIIYLFLIEKVYVVSSVATLRRDTTLYRVNILLLTPYTVILVLMILNRVAVLDVNDQCFIGLKPLASITLILYDIFISSWLTILFIRPLMSTNSVLQGPSKGKLRQVARRTLIGSIVALILSSANVFTLVYFKGYEDSVLCLLSCTLDVTLNACAVHWVTSRARGSNGTEKGGSRNHQQTPHGGIGHGAVGYSNYTHPATSTEKHIMPTDTHISVTVESYQE